MNEEEDYKKRADISIRRIEKLIEVLSTSLEKWLNSQYKDTEMGRDMIQTLKELIKEAEDEKKAYEQYKVTGVLITIKARQLLQKIMDDKLQAKKENEKKKKKEEEEEIR